MLVLVDGHARGIIVSNLITGRWSAMPPTRWCWHRRLRQRIFLSTNAMASNVTAAYRAYKKGAYFANPCFTQIHPTCIPVHGTYQSKLTLMSESLRNDGRVWVPKNRVTRAGPRFPSRAGLLPGAKIPQLRQPGAPGRGLTQRQGVSATMGRGVGETGLAVYLDFADAINRDGKDVIEKKYGNLFQMYEKITADDPYQTPMMIYPAMHYTMGGLWVDYNLMSTIPGLFVLGEANFSDHGANRLGASALMQGLADGYFVMPYTIGGYLAGTAKADGGRGHKAFDDAEKQVTGRIERLLAVNGKRTVDDFHRDPGTHHVGLLRHGQKQRRP
jgi:succinate dehydrogenase / fumarate reductase flavoprotein subunit